MNSEYKYHPTIMQKVRMKQEQERQRQMMMLLKKNQERRRKKIRKMRITIAILLLLLSVLFVYNHYRSHALERPSKVEKVEKVEKVKKQVSSKKVVKKEESQPVSPKKTIFNKNIPMPKEQQEYLYRLCKKRGLDYKKTLALIKHESNFNPNQINSTNDYGYFQVNTVNHKELAKKLHTENNPLNPYVNMNWGTFILADLYSYWGEQGYKGDKLDELVWSSYNKGITGFKKNGHATRYIQQMREAVQTIRDAF